MRNITIAISDDLRRQLLKIAGILQSKSNKKIDYEDVIRYLVRKASKNEALLRSACKPTNLSIDVLREELRKGREEDLIGEKYLEGIS